MKKDNLLKSMTGFGRAVQVLNKREILVEMRSVNHRYFEFSARLPRGFLFLEEKLKLLIKDKINRGKLEVSVTIHNIEGRETEITVNPAVVGGYVNALRAVAAEYALIDGLSLSDVLRMPDAFTVNKATVNEDEIWNDISIVANEALEKFVAMRGAEGEKIKSDMLEKLAVIETLSKEIERLSPANAEKYREKLFERMKEILDDKQIEPQRILLEAALFAEKTAVDEELVRLSSHFEQFKKMLNKEEAVGRKLDFLLQEINREVNTIGSKSQDLATTKIIVELKSIVEKIREQIQNLE